MSSASLFFTTACVAACAGLVASEWFGWRIARAGFKILASSAFLALAFTLPGGATDYGRFVVVALAFGWVGDVCLLSDRGSLFLSGLAAFLAAHVAFAAAFAQGAVDSPALVAALVVLVPAGLVAMRWLWRHLTAAYRGAVGAYVAAIAGMCALAVASSAAVGDWRVAAAALAFAASDLAVARERFVSPGVVNKLWGLPVYYLSQLTLAWSIAHRSGLSL